MSPWSELIQDFPPLIQPVLHRQVQQLQDALQRQQLAWPDDTVLGQAFLQIGARSDFVAESWAVAPAAMLDLWRSGDLQRSYLPKEIATRLSKQLDSIGDESGLFTALRQLRRREMVRIVWRDLMRWSPMQETTADMSALADACIDGALSWLYRDACKTWGTPYGKPEGFSEAVPQHMAVLGMGKLGACELNVSSDIDLMFAFPAQGETRGAARSVDNQTFFIRLGQKLIQALDKMTADGFVFRVDMRLRPYGQSGALALSFAAMEEYYQDQGRDWERYAMIKARIVAGDLVAGEQLLKELKPFVYRRYIDFSAIEALRSMKEMIEREVRRRGLESDVKLGPGGIREIEFIAQAFQLIRGGRTLQLQERSLMKVLSILAEEELMPAEHVDELQQAYVFLRNLEHAIQGLADQQTQTLPSDSLSQWRIAQSMGSACWDDLVAVLNQHRSRVSRHFADVVAPAGKTRGKESADADSLWSEFWLGELEVEEAVTRLAEKGYDRPQDVASYVANLRDGRRVQMMQAQGRERLDQFMPILLQRVAGQTGSAETLKRILRLVESVARRTAYLVLLQENPSALAELIRLCTESPWVAEQLTQTPLLLDELLHTEGLYRPLPLQELKDELRQQLLRVPPEDLEHQMDVLRQFKKANALRVAASELRGTLPIMKVSDSLTWIAEAILDQVLELAWDSMIAKYGRPLQANGEPCELEFAVIGYGKLAGLELGHGSDLDLVFLHGADLQGSTDGERPIDNGVFYTRMAQRMIHILTTQTTAGQLYDVDMRLRPSGNSGLLVTSLKAFRQYQEENAWTWEHQALVRARVVAGSGRVGAAFEAIRRDILSRRRDRASLQKEVREMREKMRENLGSKTNGEGVAHFHVKQDAGGIVDIEFITQYGVLGWACEQERLVTWPDNIRILETMGQVGVMDAEEAEQLEEIYKLYRSRVHVLALQNQDAIVPADEFVAEREAVSRLWQRFLEKPPGERLV